MATVRKEALFNMMPLASCPVLKKNKEATDQR